MQHLSPLPILALALGAALPAQATDLVACVVAPLPNNPAYYGTATTITRLKCEFTRENYYPTLGELYRQGWRLAQVVSGTGLGQGGMPVSPLYFLEREQSPATATPVPQSLAPQSPSATQALPQGDKQAPKKTK